MKKSFMIHPQYLQKYTRIKLHCTVYISGVSIGLNLTSKFMTSDQTK